jgi:hypothetical protein
MSPGGPSLLGFNPVNQYPYPSIRQCLLHIHLDDIDQFLSGFGALGGRMVIRIDYVTPNVSFDDLRDQRVNRPAAGGDRMECPKAVEDWTTQEFTRSCI